MAEYRATHGTQEDERPTKREEDMTGIEQNLLEMMDICRASAEDVHFARVALEVVREGLRAISETTEYAILTTVETALEVVERRLYEV